LAEAGERGMDGVDKPRQVMCRNRIVADVRGDNVGDVIEQGLGFSQGDPFHGSA
jgi:hypothetical protein